MIFDTIKPMMGYNRRNPAKGATLMSRTGIFDQLIVY
jgi:hypothetical protein